MSLSKARSVLGSYYFALGTLRSAPGHPGADAAPWHQEGIPCYPTAEVGSQLCDLGCPDSGMDAFPGAWEAASPEAVSSSMIPL